LLNKKYSLQGGPFCGIFEKVSKVAPLAPY